jgi:hypothetical protein
MDTTLLDQLNAHLSCIRVRLDRLDQRIDAIETALHRSYLKSLITTDQSAGQSADSGQH